MAAKYAGHETASTVLSTELNSLADGANKITGTALSNDAATTERHLFASFSLSIAATSTRTGSSVHMYILPEVDGSFVAGGDSLDPEQGYVGSFNFDLTTSARVAELRDVRLPDSNFHVLLMNELGVALAASGNTLKMEKDSYVDV